MANVKTVLDTRRSKANGTFNVIYRITNGKKVYTINSGVAILEKYWDYDSSKITTNYPNAKLLNLKLLDTYYKIEKTLLLQGEEFTIEKLRIKLGYSKNENTNQNFKQFADQIIAQMFEVKRTGNAIVYQSGVNRLLSFSNESIAFEDIDYKLLSNFEHYLKISGLKQNSISNYFRTIRAIYNLAIKHKLVDRANYPFYDISIKSQRTANRAITKVDLKRLISLPLEEDSASWRALNYFMLSFYLRGISFTDMAYLKQSNIINGRVEYIRRKTHRHYSVKLFTPAKKIINNLHQMGDDYLLPILSNNVIEDSLQAKKIIMQWIKTSNKYLKRIGEQIELDIPLTSYVSRYSYANIAKKLDFSNELIAEALGHSYGNKTTAIYLDSFDESTLDAMHYEVICFDEN